MRTKVPAAGYHYRLKAVRALWSALYPPGMFWVSVGYESGMVMKRAT